MKVIENSDKKVKPKFESFSFTIDVQTEEELKELYYRFFFNTPNLLKLCDIFSVPPKFSFSSENCKDVRGFLFDKVKSLDIEL